MSFRGFLEAGARQIALWGLAGRKNRSREGTGFIAGTPELPSFPATITKSTPFSSQLNISTGF